MPQPTWNPAWLNNDGVIVDGNVARVSRRYLNRDSDEDSSSTASQVLSPPSSSTLGSPASDTSLSIAAMAFVPLRTQCAEFFQFLGFRPEAAERLWTAWNGLTAFDKENFVADTFEFSQHWLQDRASVRCETRDDDWQSFLFTTLGLKQSFVDAIMDTQFTDLRLTAPALQWVQESQRERNDYLRDRMLASNNMINTSGTTPKYTSTPGYGAMSPTGGVPPGFTVLWRGCTQTTAKETWPSSVLHQGQFRFNGICPPASAAGALTGDLNLRQLGSYWSNQRQTAQLYAGYIYRRNTYDNVPVSVCLVRLEIPNKILESVGTITLDYPAAQFKETVWTSRCARPTPESLRTVKRSKIRIAHVCKSINQTFRDMTSPAQISEQHILKIDVGGATIMARQHFIQDDDDLNTAIEQACSQSITYRDHREPRRMLSTMD